MNTNIYNHMCQYLHLGFLLLRTFEASNPIMQNKKATPHGTTDFAVIRSLDVPLYVAN